MLNRCDSLGNDDERRVGGDRQKCSAQTCVGGKVERRERIVEHIDTRIANERSGNGETLTLSARNIGSALRNWCVEFLGHCVDEVSSLCDLECFPKLVFGCVFIGKEKVRSNRAREKIRTLRNHRHPLPKRFRFKVSNIDIVDEDFALAAVNKTRNEIDQRGFA